MRFNLDKCDVLQITGTPLQSKYAIHGQVSKNVNSAKFLGEHLLNTQLGRPRQESDADGKQQQPLILLKQKHQPFLSKHQGTTPFQTCKIIPGVRIYSLEPSKERRISQIETVQLRAARFTSGDYRDEPAVLQWWWTKTKLDSAGSQKKHTLPGHYVEQ